MEVSSFRQGSFLFKKKQENGRFLTHISLKNIDMG